MTSLAVALASVRSLAESAVTSAGYAGLAAAMALETIVPPIPSEVVLPLAGYEISRGKLSFLFALLAATAGALAGALALYAVARVGGRGAVLRLRRVLRVDERDLDRAERWFDRRGALVVFFGRMIPGARSVVSIPAGLAEMPVRRFCIATAAGSAIWNAALITAGVLLGQHYDRLERYLGPAALAALVLLSGAAIAGLIRWRNRASAAQ